MSPNSYLSEFIQILSEDVVTSEAQRLSDLNMWRRLLERHRTQLSYWISGRICYRIS